MIEGMEAVEVQESVTELMDAETINRQIEELTQDYAEAMRSGATDIAEVYRSKIEELKGKAEELKESSQPKSVEGQGEALEGQAGQEMAYDTTSDEISFGRVARSYESMLESALDRLEEYNGLVKLRSKIVERDPSSRRARIDLEYAIRGQKMAQKDVEHYRSLVK